MNKACNNDDSTCDIQDKPCDNHAKPCNNHDEPRDSMIIPAIIVLAHAMTVIDPAIIMLRHKRRASEHTAAHEVDVSQKITCLSPAIYHGIRPQIPIMCCLCVTTIIIIMCSCVTALTNVTIIIIMCSCATALTKVCICNTGLTENYESAFTHKHTNAHACTHTQYGSQHGRLPMVSIQFMIC